MGDVSVRWNSQAQHCSGRERSAVSFDAGLGVFIVNDIQLLVAVAIGLANKTKHSLPTSNEGGPFPGEQAQERAVRCPEQQDLTTSATQMPSFS